MKQRVFTYSNCRVIFTIESGYRFLRVEWENRQLELFEEEK